MGRVIAQAAFVGQAVVMGNNQFTTKLYKRNTDNAKEKKVYMKRSKNYQKGCDQLEIKTTEINIK